MQKAIAKRRGLLTILILSFTLPYISLHIMTSVTKRCVAGSVFSSAPGPWGWRVAPPPAPLPGPVQGQWLSGGFLCKGCVTASLLAAGALWIQFAWWPNVHTKGLLVPEARLQSLCLWWKPCPRASMQSHLHFAIAVLCYNGPVSFSSIILVHHQVIAEISVNLYVNLYMEKPSDLAVSISEQRCLWEMLVSIWLVDLVLQLRLHKYSC